jgi:histidinol-phosphatase
VSGLVSAPALGRRWWAGTGSGAWTGKSLAAASRMSVSRVSDLADASLSYSSLSGWHDVGREKAFLGLTRDVWRTRAYGDFWNYMLVADGAVDVAAEPQVALHDLAAPSIVVTEAGGRFTDLAGGEGPAGGSAVATNGHLHDEVLRRLTP